MASFTRQQIEAWLKNIDVSGDVIDIGGAAWPIRGRTKSWNVGNYKVLDKNYTYKKIPIDYIQDLNRPFELKEKFDVAFCIEVFEYMWNPYQAMLNMNHLLKDGGILYLSTHFMFPNHGGGTDILRITRAGINVLLTSTGFEIMEITPRKSANEQAIIEWSAHESKICKHPDEIGHFTKARKIHGL